MTNRVRPYILFLHAKDDLAWDNALVRVFEVQIGVQREAGGVFKDMSRNGSLLDHVGHSPFGQQRKA